MARRDGRRARAGAVAWTVGVVLAVAGVGAWARAGDADAPAPVASQAQTRADPTEASADNPLPRTTATTARATSTTTVATTTPATLPVPQPPPADEHAPTPEVRLGTLALPSIGVTAPLGEGVTLTQVDRSPGHWPGTAMPGEVGNVVVAGHRVTHTRPFYDLDLLRPGDPLVFTMNDGTTWTYRLTRTEIVDDEALYIVNQTPAKTATLFACHPKHSLAQRIVAHFVLAPG